MSTREPELPPSNVHHLPDRTPVGSQGRAYCGPAHGQHWSVDPVEPPPWVELPTGSTSSLYRLVRHPRTGRPARDYLGNLLYVPLADGATRADARGDAQILAFPRNGRAGRWSQQTTQDTQRAGSPASSTGAAGTGSTLDEDDTG